MKNNDNRVSLIEKISTQIVDKRNAFFLIYIISVIFCFFSYSWVVVNNDITSYLPNNTETRQGLTIMEEEFTTYGTAKVMVSNITFEQALSIKEELEAIEGISNIQFDDSVDYFKSASALFSISFEGEDKDEITQNAMESVLNYIEEYDHWVSSTVIEDAAASLEEEIRVVLLVAIFIILGVLLFTSKTYMEIPVLLITFGVAAILNMGTHFLYGEISFISNSIAVVLQLALAIDYAIILCHRFTEERKYLPAREAAINALMKSIPEISSSSLTTISGLMALMFMQFKLGFDMGIVLIKALLFSLLVVFTLMPGLLMVFSNAMDKTVHKNFVPKISKWGKFVVKTKYIIPPLFLIVAIGGFYFSSQTNYVYGYSTLTTVKKNEAQIANEKIEDTFGSDNLLAIIVPSGDYEKEGRLLKDFEKLEVTETVTGLANVKVDHRYYITDKLNPREFSELTDLDIEVSNLLYRAYAIEEGTYSKLVNGLNEYEVPLIDIFMFLYNQKEAGYFTLSQELEDEIDNLYEMLSEAKLQLESEDYSRLLINLNIPEEGEEAFQWLDKFHDMSSKYYEEVYFVGEITSNKDLGAFFAKDNIIISVLSGLFVMIILLFTFKSAGVPVLLVLTIQGSIWINFSFPAIENINIFFMSYLVVTSIQMGATIDYAIVITNRYMELKKLMPINEAMIKALNQAFPTIITSGSILSSAGLLIGRLASDPSISSIGICLGRGTIISLILVMGVLPQTLLLGDKVIEKTSFILKKPSLIGSYKGNLRINGRLQGYVSGYIDAEIKGNIRGEVKGAVEVGAKLEEQLTKEEVQE